MFKADFLHKHLITLADLEGKKSILEMMNYFPKKGIVSKFFFPNKIGSCTTTAWGREGSISDFVVRTTQNYHFLTNEKK